MQKPIQLRDKFTSEAGQKFIAGEKEYTLAGEIGTGAIGVVRRAIESKTKEQFAVKFLAPESKYIDISSLQDIAERFKKEGQKGTALSHEHLVKIYAYEENQNASNFLHNAGPPNPFIVMEYIQGTTLENFLRKRIHKATARSYNLSLQSMFIAYSVVSALHYLHLRKIVHRDVKPANIYLTRVQGETRPSLVKLGDFGVVKWGEFKASLTSGTLTVSGQQNLGTLKYMSPEQALRPKAVDVRSDMYSLGITLFELFTTQILPNIYYVLQIAQARQQRKTLVGKLLELGLDIPPETFEFLFSYVLDMFSTASQSRPSSKDMEGRLKYFLDTLGGGDLYMH